MGKMTFRITMQDGTSFTYSKEMENHNEGAFESFCALLFRKNAKYFIEENICICTEKICYIEWVK